MQSCPTCNKTFKSLKQHLQRNVRCNNINSFTKHNDLFQRNKQNGNVSIETFDEETHHTILDDFNETSNDLVNMSLFYQQSKSKLMDTHVRDIDHECYIKLLKILMDIDAPLSAFSRIMDWAVDCFHSGFQFPFNYPPRQNIISRMSEQYLMNDMKPKLNQLVLCNNQQIQVSVFDFEQMCFSLLTDDKLMVDENFTFQNDDPRDYKRPDSKDTLTCIEDGELFQSTAAKICTDKDDFCLGIKLFIDATHTDVHSNWMLDPVMFTFTFFNNEVTKQASAWRPLGFITDFGQGRLKDNREVITRDKTQDFHLQLETIFDSLIQTQKKNGFLWELKYKGKIFTVNMKPVIILIVGDTQGNHKLAGMYGSFSNTHRLNHSCNCPRSHTDDPNYKCEFVLQSDLHRLFRENQEEQLNSMSQHMIDNAFNKVVVANHIAGINAMMPSEILHQFFLGLMEYALEDFFDLFTDISKKRIDEYGICIHPYIKHNSDRSIPSISFNNGFTKLTKQRGSDRISICLISILFLYSSLSNTFQENCRAGASDNTLKKYRQLLESMLVYAEWLSKDDYKKAELDISDVKLRNFMIEFKSVVKRNSGVKLKLSKFHELLHVVRDIRLLGPPRGFDGRPGESAHKQTKRTARHTQRRTGLFEHQTSIRIYENLVINKGYSLIHNKMNSVADDNTYHKSMTAGGESYDIYMENDKIIASIENFSSIKSEVFQNGCIFLYNTLHDTFPNATIPCGTYYKVGTNEKYHAHPLFKGSESWFDWVTVSWSYSEHDIREMPARIIAFVDLRNMRSDSLEYSKSLHACVISFTDVPKRPIRRDGIVYTRKLETDDCGGFVYRLVEVDSFVSPCFCVPDIANFEICDDKYVHWLTTSSRYQWSQHF